MTSLRHFLLLTFTLTRLATAMGAVHLPLRKRGLAGPMDFTAEADKLRLKYGYRTRSDELQAQKRVLGRSSSDGLPLIDQGMDQNYIATIFIGTPPQPLNVWMDTGSSDLWVTGRPCQSCLRTTPLYDSSQSSSFNGTSGGINPALTLNYGSGSVSGSVASETVTMAGFTIENQVFVDVDNVSSRFIQGTASGIMGLAFEPLASTRATPFWLALANDGQLPSPEMSFWLARSNATLGPFKERFGGEFTLGGVNSTLFSGDIEFYDLASAPVPDRWTLLVEAITAQGQPVEISEPSAGLAVIDTGTTLIGGPSAVVANIWATVPGSAPSSTDKGFYTFPCSTQVEITISFGGKAWPISAQDMIFGPESFTAGEKICTGAIFDLTLDPELHFNDEIPPWIIGDTFLKNVYSVFRATPPSVGFAELSVFAGGTPNATAAGATGSSSAASSARATGTSTVSVAITSETPNSSHSIGISSGDKMRVSPPSFILALSLLILLL